MYEEDGVWSLKFRFSRLSLEEHLVSYGALLTAVYHAWSRFALRRELYRAIGVSCSVLFICASLNAGCSEYAARSSQLIVGIVRAVLSERSCPLISILDLLVVVRSSR